MVEEVTKIPLTIALETQPQDSRGWELPYFLAGPENPLVEPAVRAVLGGQPVHYFPVVFYGPTGVGKTHLAQGLAEAWKRMGNPGPVVVETAIDFHRQLADALESQAMTEFLERRQRAKLWILEDLETFAGKSFTQFQCLQLLDQLRLQGIPQVVTCRTLPGYIPGLEARLQSRLMRGLQVNLALPSVPTRRCFLEALAQNRRIRCTPEAISLLAARVQGPLVRVRKALMELAYGSGDRQGIHVPKVQSYLEQHHDISGKIRKIAELTAQQFSVRLRDIRGPSRKKQVVYARGAAVYLARRLLGLSFQHIGAFFGNRDHTTILHSYRKTKKLLADDPAVGHLVETLYEKLHQEGFSKSAESPPETIVRPKPKRLKN